MQTQRAKVCPRHEVANLITIYGPKVERLIIYKNNTKSRMVHALIFASLRSLALTARAMTTQAPADVTPVYSTHISACVQVVYCLNYIARLCLCCKCTEHVGYTVYLHNFVEHKFHEFCKWVLVRKNVNMKFLEIVCGMWPIWDQHSWQPQCEGLPCS